MSSSTEHLTPVTLHHELTESTGTDDRVFAGILAVIFVVGITGNAASIITYLGSRRLRLPANVFIVSLGCADLVTLFCVPFIIYNVLHPPDLIPVSALSEMTTGAGCDLLVFALRLSTSLDMLTMASIAVVRYVSIVTSSLKVSSSSLSWSQCISGVIAVWCYATFWSSLIFLPGVGKISYNSRLYVCNASSSNAPFVVASVVFIYVASVAILATCYVGIYLAVRRARRRLLQATSSAAANSGSAAGTGSSTMTEDQRQTAAAQRSAGIEANKTATVAAAAARHRRIYNRFSQLPSLTGCERRRIARETRLAMQLVVIVGVFVLCWTPYLLTMSLGMTNNVPVWLTDVFVASILTNAAINPVIYLCYNRLYRHELLLVVLCRKSSHNRRRVGPMPATPAADGILDRARVARTLQIQYDHEVGDVNNVGPVDSQVEQPANAAAQALCVMALPPVTAATMMAEMDAPRSLPGGRRPTCEADINKSAAAGASVFTVRSGTQSYSVDVGFSDFSPPAGKRRYGGNSSTGGRNFEFDEAPSCTMLAAYGC